MTVKDLYEKMSGRMPDTLREEWDNDGLMCAPDSTREVSKVLLTLDVTEELVDYAIEQGFDLIISHHPLIFKPLSAVNEQNHVARKLIKLIENEISVFSFHTRADKALGGVNDRLAELLGIENTLPFGEGELGRVGEVEEMTLEDFIYKVKTALGADVVKYSDGYNTVKRVALVGGDGKDFVGDAIKCGADTYLSGRISYNIMEEAAEMGINLVEAGHYFTEQPLMEFFKELLLEADGTLFIEVANSNMIRYI
jgi:dinuclear metal center YbgI/SA1388 family protein